MTVNSRDRVGIADIARQFSQAGFHIFATGKTHQTIRNAGIDAVKVKKLYEGRPNILDMITNGEIDVVVNTPAGKDSTQDDSYLRKAAIKAKIPYMTTLAAASAAIEGILYMKENGLGEVHSLQSLHELIK
jgi:carbamoyl-phosphate synthase large subunit